MLTLASPIVDTSALWKIIVAAFAGGAGVAVAFGIMLLGISRGQATQTVGVRVLNYGIAILAGAFCSSRWCWAFTR
jgi:hypothetical protein